MPPKLVLFCSALALAATACVPSAGENEVFGENSPMAAIQEAGELVVAVPVDSPPFSSGDPGAPEGFVVDLATDLAEALEVEARFVATSSEEMASLVAGPDPIKTGDEEVHVAFPLETVTYEIYRDVSREEGFALTTPFFIAHQRVLVPTGAGISSADDLSGKDVCTLVDETVGLPLEEVAPEADEQAALAAEDCVAALDKGRADAALASEVDLLEMLALLKERGAQADYEIVGDDLTTQGYAPYVIRGMSSFSIEVFTEAQDDGRWAAAYERWIEPLTAETIPPPELTLQEAAALYPVES